jgi:hypothetical protein
MREKVTAMRRLRIQAQKPRKIRRDFVRSRLEEEFLATAYEALVPIPRVLRKKGKARREQASQGSVG